MDSRQSEIIHKLVIELRDHIVRMRNGIGWSICTVEPVAGPWTRDNVISTIDQFTLAKGYYALGSAWQAVPREDAIRFLSAVIARDMAYGIQQCPIEEAERLTASFIDFFADDAIIFSNVSDAHGPIAPLTSATFECGMVVLDEELIGILWIQDED